MDLPSAGIFFLYLVLYTNFFSGHFPLLDLFLVFSHPSHHFSNGQSLSTLVVHPVLVHDFVSSRMECGLRIQGDFITFHSPERN